MCIATNTHRLTHSQECHLATVAVVVVEVLNFQGPATVQNPAGRNTVLQKQPIAAQAPAHKDNESRVNFTTVLKNPLAKRMLIINMETFLSSFFCEAAKLGEGWRKAEPHVENPLPPRIVIVE